MDVKICRFREVGKQGERVTEEKKGESHHINGHSDRNVFNRIRSVLWEQR